MGPVVPDDGPYDLGPICKIPVHMEVRPAPSAQGPNKVTVASECSLSERSKVSELDILDHMCRGWGRRVVNKEVGAESRPPFNAGGPGEVHDFGSIGRAVKRYSGMLVDQCRGDGDLRAADTGDCRGIKVKREARDSRWFGGCNCELVPNAPPGGILDTDD